MADTKLNIIINAKDNASKALKGISGALGNMAKFAAKTAAIGIGATTAALGGLTVAVGKLADEGAKLQGIEDAFQGFAGDQAGDLLDNMKKLSNGLITQTDLMKNYNLATQLVSKQFADTLPEAMQYLTKVAAATGQDLDFLMSSLVTGIGRESKMILDNLGITVKTMDELLQDEAQRLGIAAEEFDAWADSLDNASRKALLTNHVMELLAKNTANLKEVVNPVQQIKTAFADLGDTFKKSVFKMVLPFLERIAPKIIDIFDLFKRFVLLKDVFEDTITEVNKLPKPLRTFFNIAREVFRFFETLFARGLGAAFSQIGSVIRNAIGEKAYNALMKFINIGRDVFDFFRNLWRYISTGISEGDWFNDWITHLPEPMQVFIRFVRDTVIPRLGELFEWLKEKIPQAIEWLKNKWDELRPAIDNVKNAIVDGLLPKLTELKTVIVEDFIPSIQDTLDTFFDVNVETGNLTESMSTLGSTLSGAVQLSLSILNLLFTALGAVLKEVIQLVDKISAMFDKGSEKSKTFSERLVGLAEAINGIAQAIRDLGRIPGASELGLMLAEYLIPKSPTPLEIGLRGIRKEMDLLSRTSVPNLSDSFMSIPRQNPLDNTANMMPALAPVRSNMPSGNMVINIQYSPGMSLGNRREFETQLVPLVDNAMRRVHRGRP